MSFKRHKIFKSGIHNPAKGKKVWLVDDVKDLLAKTKEHSPELIPYTFRHPKNNLPVFGFARRDEIDGCEVDGEFVLTAQPTEFARPWIDALKQLGTDMVSVGIGKMGEIAHIGFTDSPGVDGLGAAFEAEKDSLQQVPVAAVEEVEFEAADLDNPAEALFEVSWKWRLENWMQDAAGIFKRLRDREIEANGVEAADKLIPDYMIDFLKEPLPEDEPKAEDTGAYEKVLDQFGIPKEGSGTPMPKVKHPKGSADFSDNNKPGSTMNEKELQEFEQLKNDNEELKKKNNELLQKESEAEIARVDAEIEGFCSKHATIVVPKIKPQVKAILRDLYGAEKQVFEAGDGKTVEKSSYDLMKEIISGGKVQFLFEEIASKDKAGEQEGPDPNADPVADELKAQFERAKGAA